MIDADLRAKLTKAWTRRDWEDGRRPESKPWEKLDAKTQRRLTDRIESLRGELITDALMPIVREALAAAWDDGHRTANPVIPDTHRDVINPWKQP